MNQSERREFFTASPVLVLTAGVMLIDLAVCLVGLFFDRTVITGMPAWVKPTKFALSTGIYALSLVVVIRYTPIWRKALRAAEFLIGLSLTVEIILIDIQAARHTTSHFNLSTPVDKLVWQTMGAMIGIFWLSSILVAVAALRTRYATRLWTIAVRSGMLLSVAGSGTGFFMATPSHIQLEAAKQTHHMPVAGSHTIGGVDGGPGVPMLGWSTQYGDVRIAHFLGLHSIQALALVAFVLQRRRVAEAQAEQILSAAVFTYASLFCLVLIEALTRHPITDHSAALVVAWALWVGVSVALFARAMRMQPVLA